VIFCETFLSLAANLTGFVGDSLFPPPDPVRKSFRPDVEFPFSPHAPHQAFFSSTRSFYFFLCALPVKVKFAPPRSGEVFFNSQSSANGNDCAATLPGLSSSHLTEVRPYFGSAVRLFGQRSCHLLPPIFKFCAWLLSRLSASVFPFFKRLPGPSPPVDVTDFLISLPRRLLSSPFLASRRRYFWRDLFFFNASPFSGFYRFLCARSLR